VVGTIRRAKLLFHLKRAFCAAALLTSVTGCLGGGGGGSNQQASLGSVEFIGITVQTYDALAVELLVQGRLRLNGATDLNQVSIYTDANCLVEKVGQGIHQDFFGSGISISIPSTSVTDLYVLTNTSDDCFFLHEYLPRFDAPPGPTFSSFSPSSPSRITYQPYISGDASATTSTVKFFTDNLCTVQVGAGTVQQFRSIGIQLTLLADSDSQVYATATDAFGKTSTCTLLASFLHDSNGPAVPAYSSVVPVSPSGASTTPLIIGTVSMESQLVSIYTDAACTVLSGSGTPADFRTTGVQVTAALNSSTSFYGTSTDQNMVVSDCAFLTIFTHDSVAPAAPTFTNTDPLSPTRTTLVPKIRGTAASDAQQVRLYSNAACTTMTGSGTKATFEGAGIPTAILPNESTNIYAQAFDAAGNNSACTFMATFVHDTIAPDPPIFAMSTPASPNNQSVTPRIQGTTDISAVDVKIYNDDTCLNLIGSGTAEAFDSPGIQVTVTGNTTTTLYATSADNAGNNSSCSALANYAHSTVPAPSPGFFVATPVSPTRVTNRPYIVGTAVNTITRVTLYSDVSCTGSLGTANRSLFVTSGIQATVAMNAQTSLYAISEDVYGNTSPCTFLTNYIHNTVPPFDPLFTSVTPLSPNNSSTSPVIVGSLIFDPGNILQPIEVSLYDNFLCLNRIGTGTPSAFQTTGLVANVPPNTASSIYARVFDAAGNSSACTHLTDYTHDALVPGRPLLGGVTPGTPSYTSEVVLAGNIGTTTDFLPATNLVIYSDAACGTQIKSDPVSLFTNGTYPLNVAENTIAPLYGAIFNAVGTASPCTLLVNYRHSDVGPASLMATQGADGSVSLNWLPDNIANPTPAYEVRRSLISGGPYTTITENLNGATFTDYNVSNGQTYYYVVAARNVTGASKNSSEISHTVSVAVPAGIIGLSSSPGPAQVTLNWVGASENMSYSVRRSTSRGGPYATVAAALTTATYIDTTVTNGTTYYYVVTGRNPAGASVDSNETQVTPLGIPLPPTNLVLTQLPSSADCGGSPGVLLAWTPPTYYSNFSVYRGTNSSSGTPIFSTTSTSWVDCNPANDINGGGQADYNYYSIVANWGPLQSGESNKVVFVNDGAGTIRVDPGNGLVNVTWTAVNNSIRYHLYRSTVSNGPYSLLDNTITSTSYVDSTVSNGQAYFYVLYAEYPNDGAVGWRTNEQAGVPGTNPGGPSSLSVTVNTSRQPVLNWTAPEAFNFFRIYRSSNAGGPYTLSGTSNTSSYVDPSPNVGMNFYRVVRLWGTSESAPSNTVQLRYGFPITISSTQNTTQINVTWSGVSGALEYDVYRSNFSGGPYTLLTTTSATSHADLTAVINQGYFYVVQAKFADLTVGQLSNEVSGTLSNSTIPNALTVIGTTQSSVNLNWPKISGATSYKIYRASNAGGPYTLVSQQGSIGLNVTALAGLTQHFFRYSFVRAGLESAASSSISAYTYATPSAPSVSAGNNSVSLTWGAVGAASTYDVDRSTDGLSFSSLVTGLGSPAYTDNTASNGTLYFYRVTAVFPTESKTSAISSGVTPGITPRTPISLSVTENLTGTDIELSWGPSPGVSLYRIYQSTVSGGPYTQVSQTASTFENPVGSLSAGTKYFYVVRAVIGSIESASSNEVSVIPLLTPNGPVAIVNGASIDVTWTAVAGASTYDLERSSDRGNYASISSGLGTTSFTDNTAVAGTTYSYRFIPRDALGTAFATSLPSADVSFGLAPEIPRNLIGFATSNSAIQLDWIPTPNSVGYVLSRSTVSGGPYVAVTSTTAVTYLDSGLTPGTVYYYTVTARDQSGNLSAISNEAAVSLAAVPTGLVATAMPSYQQLNWNAVGGATGYSVFRSRTAGGPYGKIANGVATTSYQDSNITDGLLYYYVIAAEFSGVLSVFSNEASATAIRRMNIQVPIELVDQSLSSADTVTTFQRTLTTLDTSFYDGTVVYDLEVVATNQDTFGRNIELVNSSNAVVAAVVVPASTTNRTRLRSTFTPTPGSNRYRVRVAGTTSSGQLEVSTARVLVTQTAASRTAIYIPLLTSSAGAYTGDETGPISITTATSYQSLSEATIYKRQASKYAQLISQNPWLLETLVSATGSAVGAVALYNTAQAAHVDDTESIFEGSAVQLSLAPFQEGVTGFSSSNENESYQVAIRCLANCDDGQVQLYKAGLWVRLENLDKAQVIFRTSLGASPSGPTDYDHQRTLINLSLYSNPVAYFQATATLMNGMNPGSIFLNTHGANEFGTAGLTPIANSALSIDSSSKSLVRSPALTLNSGDRFIPSADPTTSSMSMTDSAIVIETSY
jgi:fibronectin type 3 domain-containing protein